MISAHARDLRATWTLDHSLIFAKIIFRKLEPVAHSDCLADEELHHAVRTKVVVVITEIDEGLMLHSDAGNRSLVDALAAVMDDFRTRRVIHLVAPSLERVTISEVYLIHRKPFIQQTDLFPRVAANDKGGAAQRFDYLLVRVIKVRRIVSGSNSAFGKELV
jgi:hypothetical protein